ncbi:MAG: efflux RND transporter permease subunit [bacterium]|nr:efflux RND transporter permease subunit [bacterium]
MKLVKFSLEHPVSIFMFTLAALIFGFISYTKLTMNLLPTISYPTLTIKTEYAGTAPAEIEHNISKPVEEAVGVVDNVVRISSISKAEVSEVMVEFAWDTNMDFATLKVREKLDLLNLPEDSQKSIILRYDPNTEPVMKLGITGEPELSRIRYLAETDIKQALESIEGVAACSVSGGLEDEIHIDIDENQVSLLNIPMSTIGNRLAQENVNLSAGILKQRNSRYLVRTVNEFKTVDEINEIIIDKRNGIPIKLGSIARVYRGYKERKVISRINGKECIEAAIYRAADANTVTVANAVLERLKKIEKNIFATRRIQYTIITNQSKFIEKTIDEVIHTAVLGGILAIMVLLYFLKNARSTIIIGVAIPVSVIVTFFLMYSFDISLNIISLGGLALGIGMLVDNSIVVLEAIQRFREKGKDPRQAALLGTSEVAGAVTASTFTTVAVFFPIVFVEGIAGQLFKDMALTVTFSLLASLVASLTLVPMLFSVMRRKNSRDGLDRLFQKLFKPLDTPYNAFFTSYTKFQGVSFKWKKAIVFSVVAAFLLSIGAAFTMDKELIPVISQGEFLVNIEFKPGTSLKTNLEVITRIAEKFKRHEEVESIYELIGKGSRGGISFQEEKENLSEFTVRLKKGILGKDEKNVMELIREDLKEFPGLKSKIYRPRLFSFNAPLEVVISGNNLDELKRVSDELLVKMRGKIATGEDDHPSTPGGEATAGEETGADDSGNPSLRGGVEGLIDLKSSMEEGYPEIQIVFNRARLASQEMTINDVGSQVRSKVEGDVATKFIESDREVDIRVRVAEGFRDRMEKIKRMGVRNGLGIVVPLKAVAEIKIKEGPAEIRRIYQQKSAVITGNINGIDLDEAGAAILNLAASITKPEDFNIYLAGQSKEMNVAFRSMIFAISLAVFLVYLVMASQFESFRKPFIIMFSIPLGIIGVAAVGLLAGITINVVVLIGLVIMSGIIVNDAIVLVDYTSQLQREGMKKREAVITAARVRWRPILMTTVTTVLGLMPMALDFNEGFEIRIPLAVTLIGGMIFGTFLTLVFIPIIYDKVVKETPEKKETTNETATI